MPTTGVSWMPCALVNCSFATGQGPGVPKVTAPELS
jgi:hypothetical protein